MSPARRGTAATLTKPDRNAKGAGACTVESLAYNWRRVSWSRDVRSAAPGSPANACLRARRSHRFLRARRRLGLRRRLAGGHRARGRDALLRLQRGPDPAPATRGSTAALAGCRHSVHYALKANSTLGLVRLIQGLGASADCQFGRRDRGRRSRPASSRTRSSSPASARAPPRLARAVALGLKAINAESRGELERIDAESIAPGPPHPRGAAGQPRRRRAEPSAHLHRDASRNKFGVPIDDARALAREMARRGPACSVVGVHVHVGSQITTLEPLSARRGAHDRARRGPAGRRRRRSSTSTSAAASASATTAAPEPDVDAYAGDRSRRRADHRPLAHRRARSLAGRATPARCWPRSSTSSRRRTTRRPRRRRRPPVRRPRRRHDRPDAAGALRRRPPHRARRAADRAGSCRATSSARSARAATPSSAIARLVDPHVGALRRDPRRRRLRRGDGLELQPAAAARRRCSSTTGAGASSAAAQTRRRHGARSRCRPDRVRRARPERQGNPGGAPSGRARSGGPRASRR